MRYLPSRKQFALGSAATLAGTRAASAADSFTLRLSTTGNSTTIWYFAATRLSESVARRSNGRLRIEIYPNSQLAKEVETIQGLTTGTVDLAIESSVFVEPILPQMQVFTLPFMFKNAAAAFRVVDGPIGEELFAALDQKGIAGLAWGGTGFREIETVNKAVKVPEDMKGLRLRVQGGAVYVGMAQALGALPVTIDFSEVYAALSQHTIDAIDNTPEGVVDLKLYTVVNHLALTNHIFTVQPLLGSKAKISALPPDLQKILKDEAKALVPYWRGVLTQHAAESLETLKSKGMTITEVDFPAFRRAMEPVYGALQSKLGGDLIQRAVRAANA